MGTKTVFDMLKSGERSRLIPVVSDMSKEERAVSPVMAAFSVVPSFANSMLSEVGGPTNQRAKVKCFSQVVFTEGPTDRKLRPDGLIVVDSGRKIWSALVEAKIGNAELSAQQVEDYLDIARHLGIDAVITISNQFAADPTHHPVSVNKQKLRSVQLYHFSWLALLTNATLLAEGKEVADSEQAFILQELTRYLSHRSSGVCSMTRMGGGWKDLCMKIQAGTPIPRTDDQATAAVSDWHQLCRFLALDLTAAIGKPVSVWLPRAHQVDPTVRRDTDIATLCVDHTLRAELTVPNAASKVVIEADFLRRTVRFSTEVVTPKNKSRATSVVTWVTRQIPKLHASSDTLLRLQWGRRIPDTVVTVAEAVADPKVAAPADRKDLPTSAKVQRVVDFAVRFKGPATFVEDITRELPRYYQDVVQNLSNWTDKPPKIADVMPAPTGTDEILKEVETIRVSAKSDTSAT